MYQKIKYWVFLVLYLGLWTVFFLKSADPTVLGHAANSKGAIPIYEGWRGLLDGLYMVVGWVNWPVQFLVDSLVKLAPAFKTNWFPQWEGALFAESIEKFLTANKSIPFPQPWRDGITAGVLEQVIAGSFIWSYIFTILMVALIEKLVDPLYETLYNLIWNVLIEFSFTKKKQDKYQSELEQRTETMIKLHKANLDLSHQTTELQTSVITDEMTQVYNKRFFVQKMAEEMERAVKNKTVFALVMMDIDHFKKFNDTYGHLLGDKVLIKVAEAAKKHTPRGCYCCRYGGEEFGVIMPAKNFEEVMFIVDSIRNAIPQIRLEDDPNIQVAISQGLIILDYSNPSNQQLGKYLDVVKLADDELYRAKQEGRNRCCYKRLDQAGV